MAHQFDYVIVGGGSAGCVLANRLSAVPHYRVCLLEAGPRDRSAFIMMPGGIIPLMRSNKYNWQYRTVKQPTCANREMLWPRGRTLGGSSSINAMCYIRGNPGDYDHWAELGNGGWSWREVLPYFRKSENFEPGESELHGVGGPLNVARLRHTNRLAQVFLDAAQQAGHPRSDNFNGAQQDGFGWYHVTQKGGQRCSNARAYLHEAETRDNLTVITDALAVRILFQGRRAVGVRYRHRGRYHEARAAREVVLSAGAVGSPQLLLLSGVGPAGQVSRHGLEPVHELPGVGENLQDHVDAYVTFRCRTRDPVSMHPASIWRMLKAAYQYVRRREGELASNIAEAGGFLKTRPEEPVPDLQLFFVALVNTRHAQELWPLISRYAFTILACDLRPQSRGRITLASADPLAHPSIDANYLATERDVNKLITAVHKAREILLQPAFTPYRGEELAPGPAVRSDEEIRDWLRHNAETLYHPVGTCKMGDDRMAVVDRRLRVHGLAGLRVVDASIMPTLVGGNTNAPTTMIAEKGADMLLQDAAADGEAVFPTTEDEIANVVA